MGFIQAMFSLISFLAARKQILQSWTLQQTFCALDDSTEMMVCFIKVIIVNTKKPREKRTAQKIRLESLSPSNCRSYQQPGWTGSFKYQTYTEVSSHPEHPSNPAAAHWLADWQGSQGREGPHRAEHWDPPTPAQALGIALDDSCCHSSSRLLPAFPRIKWMQSILWSTPKEDEEKQHFKACSKYRATVLINTILQHGERYSEWVILVKHHPKHHSECPCARTCYQVAKRCFAGRISTEDLISKDAINNTWREQSHGKPFGIS